jgi:large repetitive protein
MANTPQVVVNPAITLPAITHADVCVDGTIDLPPANPSGGSGNFSYSWTTVSGTPHTSSLQDPAPFSPTVTGPHSYNVLVTDAGFSTTSGGLAVCTMTRNVDFAVNPLPVNKTIAPNAALICYNTPTLINIPASQAGVRYYVYRTDNTPVGDVLGDGGLVSVGTGLLTANTSFYAVAVNVTTNCSRTLNTVTVNVNPRFELAQLHQSQNICINFAADIRVNMTGGVGPYTVNYTAGVSRSLQEPTT